MFKRYCTISITSKCDPQLVLEEIINLDTFIIPTSDVVFAVQNHDLNSVTHYFLIKRKNNKYDFIIQDYNHDNPSTWEEKQEEFNKRLNKLVLLGVINLEQEV